MLPSYLRLCYVNLLDALVNRPILDALEPVGIATQGDGEFHNTSPLNADSPVDLATAIPVSPLFSNCPVCFACDLAGVQCQ